MGYIVEIQLVEPNLKIILLHIWKGIIISPTRAVIKNSLVLGNERLKIGNSAVDINENKLNLYLILT